MEHHDIAGVPSASQSWDSACTLQPRVSKPNLVFVSSEVLLSTRDFCEVYCCNDLSMQYFHYIHFQSMMLSISAYLWFQYSMSLLSPETQLQLPSGELREIGQLTHPESSWWIFQTCLPGIVGSKLQPCPECHAAKLHIPVTNNATGCKCNVS